MIRQTKLIHSTVSLMTGAMALLSAAAPALAAEQPNIVVIWGDDIGVHNVSAYNNGIMGYQTPNIDRIGREGMIFTHAYAQQSCTAGRASFILGQHPFRTGLLTIGMPGSDHGITDYLFQSGASLNAAGINYQTLKAQEILKKLETLTTPRN